tara:strand:+ start:890 stop:1021 length:132 start_codon:yes stop_codon:yes gene_type:complete
MINEARRGRVREAVEVVLLSLLRRKKIWWQQPSRRSIDPKEIL